MSTKTPAVVVTGGAGYIGSHVVAELIKADHDIVVIDDLSTGSKNNLFEGPDFIKGDFSSKQVWDKVLKKYSVRAVMHLAGSIDANESLLKPSLYLQNNTLKTAKLLEILDANRITKLIFSSTAAVYGPQIILPIPENAILHPVNPYGESKLLAEKLIAFHSHYQKLDAIILRFFNASGTSGEVSVLPKNKTSLIAQIRAVLSGKQNRLKIYGDEHDTKDGTCVRDLVHVVDIARAHVAALEHLLKQTGLSVFNIGTGHGYSVLEIIAAAEKVTGHKVKTTIVKPRLNEIPISVADTKAIRTQLKFELKYSALEDILSSIL